MADSSTNLSAATPPSAEPVPQGTQAATLSKIESLLKAKDDTSRFVGLALLKSVLDSSPEIRHNEDTVNRLWLSISPKFLDRLIKTGSGQGNLAKDAKEMLSIAVSVIHTFATLIPDNSKSESRLVNRIPSLVASILHSSEETTRLALRTLLTLTSFPEGAKVFAGLDDLSPLTEVATTHPEALQVLTMAWLDSTEQFADKSILRLQIDQTIQRLVISFKTTDAVTLLEFLACLLRNVDPEVVPQKPKWLGAVIGLIQNLVTSRPTPEARSAYTNLAACFLHVYPIQAPNLLFASQPSGEKSFSFLLVNLLLIDIRSSCPTLLERLNTHEYDKTATRLASAYDVVSSFMGFLVRSLDSDEDSLPVSPDLLLKLRKSISETMSVTAEYLRDRWDASVAGAMGLHPDARVGKAETSAGSRLTLAWDSAKDSASDDPLILAAVRALAVWLREDDNDAFRKEASGLMDMFMDLYRCSSSGKLDFRSPILVALEGITAVEEGVEAFLTNDGWKTLIDDALMILQLTTRESDENEASRGTDVVRILLPIVEAEHTSTREDWMNTITAIAAWETPDTEQPPTVQEFQVAVLQLSASLLTNAGAGMRRRYVHSTTAILGVANHVRRNIPGDSPLRELVDDVLVTLDSLR